MSNPAWAQSQRQALPHLQGPRKGRPSPDSLADMPPGMPPPWPGFLQLGKLAPGTTLKQLRPEAPGWNTGSQGWGDSQGEDLS